MRSRTLAWAAWACLDFGLKGLQAQAEPTVLSVPAGDFLGDDGGYTAFSLSVGTPEQILSFFPSTASSQLLLVTPRGCPATIADCAVSRGGLYDVSKSSSWSIDGSGNVTLEQNLNIKADAIFGTESVSIDSLALKELTVSQITLEDYWVNSLGLHEWTNASSAENDNPGDILSALKDGETTPSLTYAYAAGAQYRFKGVQGSLTFGGYDSSRFDPTKLGVFDHDTGNNELAVDLVSISTSVNGTSTQLLQNRTRAVIDTTVTDLWLPTAVCRQFESAFNVSWNDTGDFYHLSDTAHMALQNANPNITFTLGDTADGNTLQLVLPYNAFDKTASWPRYNNYPRSVPYFPLRRANSSQVTIGRAFFQEVYLINNFENLTFTLAQAVFSDSTPPALFNILANGTTVPVTSSASGPSSGQGASNGDNSGGGSGSGSNSTAIGAGVGVGVGVPLVAVVAACCFFRRRKNKKRDVKKPAAAAEVSEKKGPAVTAASPTSPTSPTSPKPQLGTGLDHEIYEVGSPASPRGFVLGGDNADTPLSELPGDTDQAAPTAELRANQARAELGTSYSGAELVGSPVHAPQEVHANTMQSPVSALRSGTTSPTDLRQSTVSPTSEPRSAR